MNTKWPTISLGELSVNRGGSSNPAKFEDEIFELYSIPAYDYGQPEILPGKDIGSSKKNVEPNDILLSRIVPHIQRVWLVNLGKGYRQIASSEWIIYRSNKFYPPFLRYALLTKQFHRQFMTTISGVGGSLLRARPDLVNKIKIPLPPIDEQQRIVSILDKADKIRLKRQKSIKLAEEFLRSVFFDIFGDPVTNPMMWSETHLNDIADIVSGVTKGRKFNGKTTTFVPYMRVANVQDGHIDLSDVQEIEVIESEVEKYKLIKGDILLTEGGDPDKLGRGSVWTGEIEPCIHQNHIFRLRVDKKEILPEYLSTLIGSARGKRYFLKAAKQTTGVASINKTQLKQFPALIPPMDKQLQFQNIKKKIDHFLFDIEKMIKESDKLFSSISQRAFKGEL